MSILLAAYLPIDPQTGQPIVLTIKEQVGNSLGTQPSFTRVLTSDNRWSINGGNVTITSTGIYELTINACSLLSSGQPGVKADGGWSVYATLNGSTLDNVVSDTIVSETVEDAPDPGISSATVTSVSSSSIIRLCSGDILGFWASSLFRGVNRVLLVAEGTSVLNYFGISPPHNPLDIHQPWYRVTLGKT